MAAQITTLNLQEDHHWGVIKNDWLAIVAVGFTIALLICAWQGGSIVLLSWGSDGYRLFGCYK